MPSVGSTPPAWAVVSLSVMFRWCLGHVYVVSLSCSGGVSVMFRWRLGPVMSRWGLGHEVVSR